MRALTHNSFFKELKACEPYCRDLDFAGEKFLQYLVSEYVYNKYTNKDNDS